MKEYGYICSRIDCDLKYRLKVHCAKREISVKDLLSLAIKDYIERYEKITQDLKNI